MGKKLIIKGGNFALNALRTEVPLPTTSTWYIDTTDGSKGASAVGSSGGWALSERDNALFVGKPINAIKIYPTQAGTLNLYVKSQNDFTSPLSNPIASVTLTSEEVNAGTAHTYKLSSVITVPEGQYLVLGEPNTSGLFSYTGGGTSGQDSFWRKIGSSNCDFFGSQQNQQGTYSLLQIGIGYQI